MIAFTNKHNGIVDKVTLSNAVEWYAKLKGVTLHNVQRLLFVSSYGYLCVSIGRECVRVSRLLMMYHLKRELSSKEWVHHKDENKLNNVLSNLELMSDAEHGMYHNKRADVIESAIKELLSRGKSQNDIARYLKCSGPSINRRVKRMREEEVV